MRPKTGRIGSGEHSPRFRNKETPKDPDARFLSLGLREGMTISLELRKLVRMGDAPPPLLSSATKLGPGAMAVGLALVIAVVLLGLVATSPADAAPRFKTVTRTFKNTGFV